MTELEKKVFREVFVNKPIMFHSDDCLLKIRDFFEKFGVGYLDFPTGYTHNVIMLNDNLNAYYLQQHRFNISDRIYNFDLLLQDYKETIRRKKMSKSIYNEALKELTWLVHDEFYETPKRLILNASQRLDMFKKVRDTLEKAQKQEKLLNKIKDIINRPYNSYIFSKFEQPERYVEISKLIKELENDK